MNKLRQHIPNFAYDPRNEIKEWEFETVEQLLNLDWVKGFSEEGSTFCVSDKTLMIVKNDNSHWWVVGHLKEDVDLPKWKYGEGIIWL